MGYGYQWRKLRAQILAQSDICWMCGQPGADTVDHILEIKRGGAVLDPANLRPAHGKKRPGCRGNYSRSAGLRRATPRRKNPQVNDVSRPW